MYAFELTILGSNILVYMYLGKSVLLAKIARGLVDNCTQGLNVVSTELS